MQAVDVDSIFLGCKYAMPLMRDHGLGSIVNISSIAGIIASHNYVSYNAAKAAVRHMSKSIALHGAKTGGKIRCNSVHPTFINTPILDGVKEMFGEEEGLAKLARQVPLGKVGEPDDIADDDDDEEEMDSEDVTFNVRKLIDFKVITNRFSSRNIPS